MRRGAALRKAETETLTSLCLMLILGYLQRVAVCECCRRLGDTCCIRTYRPTR
jgi:hypothetical protein